MNTHIPADCGGAELGALDGIIIAEELAWGCTGVGTAIEANGLAQQPVILGASDALKKKYLAPMTENPTMCAYAVTEPGAGSDVQGLRTTAESAATSGSSTARRCGSPTGRGRLVLRGRPHRPREEGSRRHDRLHRRARLGWRHGGQEGDEHGSALQRHARAITFEDVEVPEENVVGEVGDGWRLAMAAFDYTRPGGGNGCRRFGLVRAAMEHAAQLRHRASQAFGKSRSPHHQAVAFMIAEMDDEHRGRPPCCATKAGWLKRLRGKRNTRSKRPIAKAFCADIAMKVATDAVQVHGGYGYSNEYPVEKLMRDAKVFQIYEGTSQIQRLIVSREMFRG